MVHPSTSQNMLFGEAIRLKYVDKRTVPYHANFVRFHSKLTNDMINTIGTGRCIHEKTHHSHRATHVYVPNKNLCVLAMGAKPTSHHFVGSRVFEKLDYHRSS